MAGLLLNLIRRPRSYDTERPRRGPKSYRHRKCGGGQGGQGLVAFLQRAKDRGEGREERNLGWLLWLGMGSEWFMACRKRVCLVFCFESAPGSADPGFAAAPSGWGMIKTAEPIVKRSFLHPSNQEEKTLGKDRN